LKPNSNSITNSEAEFYINDEGIIIAEYHEEDFTLEKEDAIRVINNIKSLAKGNITPSLFIASKGFSSTNEAREYFVKNLPKNDISALALVISSLGQKIIGNFFIKVQKPNIPTKIFKTKEEALIWLETFL